MNEIDIDYILWQYGEYDIKNNIFHKCKSIFY